MANQQQAADIADSVTRGAALTGFVSGMIEWAHSALGWLVSGQGLAMLSVSIAVVSGLAGLYWRRREARYKKQEAEYARMRSIQETEYHIARMRQLPGYSDFGTMPTTKEDCNV